MSEMIEMELTFLLASIIWGLILIATYDVVRIFRRVVPHPFILIAIEDILYWSIGGILVFQMIYEKNNGTIRGFSIVAMGFSMFFYYYLIGDVIVNVVAGFFNRIKHTIKVFLGYVFKPFRCIVGYLLQKLKVLKKNTRKILKKSKKTVTIASKKK